MLYSRSPRRGNRKTQGLLSSAAHELFHAITFAYQVVEGCEVRWIREGTATWAENFIYPHPTASTTRRGISRTDSEVDRQSGGDESEDGTYLLPLYLEKSSGGPAFMRTMWETFVKLKRRPFRTARRRRRSSNASEPIG